MATTEESDRLFISYATDDAARVLEFTRALELEGVRIWLDQNDIQPSDSLVRRINDGIAGAKFAILFFSARYAAKPWTTAEHDAIVAAAVVNNDRKVFVVRLDDTPLPPLLSGKLYFRSCESPKLVAERIAHITRTPTQTPAGSVPAILRSPAPPTVSVTDLQTVSVESLAEVLLTGGLRRMTGSAAGSTIDGYLHGVGPVRATIRRTAVTSDRLADFDSIFQICATHRRYIAELKADLAEGGLGHFKAGWLIKVERRTTELAETREQLRQFLVGFVSKVEVV